MTEATNHIVQLSTRVEDRKALLEQAEAIFWDSAAVRNFAAEEARAEYRDLWFGRYEQHAPEEFLLALGDDNDVRGYLAGSLISNAPPLPGPDYYELFRPRLIERHPAHLHINIRAYLRNTGIGGELMRAFYKHCRSRKVEGVHAVTLAGSRPAAFFEKHGLSPLGKAEWRGRPLVFMGRQFT
jgi:RimJ/RimL family protein N-acetyltransferase